MLAVYLGLGYDKTIAAAKVGMTLEAVTAACQDSAFVAQVARLAEQHAAMMSDMLENAEVMAIQTLTDLLDSDDEEVRLKAAMNLLDRAGRRGTPVTKVEQNTVQRTVELKGDMNEALSKALIDPGVRAWLQQHPGFLALQPTSGIPERVEPNGTMLRVDWEYATDQVEESPDPSLRILQVEDGGQSGGVDGHSDTNDLSSGREDVRRESGSP